MTSVTDKVIQGLRESLAAEDVIVEMFTTHLAATSEGGYRKVLERHARQARKHSWQVSIRLADYGKQHGLVRSGLELAWMLAGQTIAMSKIPLNRLRGVGRKENFIENVRDEYAAVTFALAAYQTLAQAAGAVGDEDTAQLAGAIWRDHQSLLTELQEIIGEHAAAADPSGTDTGRRTKDQMAGTRRR